MGLFRGARRALKTFPLIAPAFIALYSCAPPEPAIRCVPDEVSRLSKAITERDLQDRIAAANAGRGPADQADDASAKIEVFLDASESIRGYLRGANCPSCQDGPNAGNKDASPDPFFATLIRLLTDVPGAVGKGMPATYHLFASRIVDNTNKTPISQGTLWKIVDSSKAGLPCYKDGPKPPSKEFLRINCEFDSEKLMKDVDRTTSPIGGVFNRIASDGNKNDLHIVATDLFFRDNNEFSGANSSAIAPLIKMIKNGYHIRLFGFVLPFKGWIDDIPDRFEFSGSLPFYFLAIGSPQQVERFSQFINDSADRILVWQDGNRIKLSDSNRFRTMLIGSGVGTVKQLVRPEVSFPSSSRDANRSLVVDSTIGEERILPMQSDLFKTGSPIQITWMREGGITGPFNPSDFEERILAWEAVPGAVNSCGTTWRLVSRSRLNPGRLTRLNASRLSSSIFNGGGAFSVDRDVTYIIQASLFSRHGAKSGDNDWISLWSSDNISFPDDKANSLAAAAKGRPGFFRTYNLKTFLSAIELYAPKIPMANLPVASTTISVKFR